MLGGRVGSVWYREEFPVRVNEIGALTCVASQFKYIPAFVFEQCGSAAQAASDPKLCQPVVPWNGISPGTAVIPYPAG